ncbi:MAG: 4Fe-4S dicluster domain-containing protein [Myxococcota bacterium]
MTQNKTELSRREFLGSAALGVAGAGVGVALILPQELAAAETQGYDWDKHRWVYLIDTTKCIGCGSCVRACKAENDVPQEFFRTWIERYEISVDGQTYVDSPNGGADGFDPVASGMNVGKAFFVPKMCNHCEATPCTQVCPVGASYSTRDGVVLVDPEHCIGCGYCVQACPYGSRYLNPETHTADKCTWCYHRITQGLLPACVQACPNAARIFGDRKNPDDPINQILATERLHVLQPELLTKPQCFYRGLSMEVR